MRNLTIKTLSMTTALILAAGHANASGFQLKEQGAGLQGLSFAGATAKADDLSTLFFNPAGMTRLKGDQAEANVSYIAPSSQLTIDSVNAGTNGFPTSADGNGGDAGEAAAVPAIYAFWDYSDKVKLGLSVNTPFGLSTSYEDGWAGRYHALDSELMTINISPVIGYKIDKNWSVGGGLQMQYADARLTKAINANALSAGLPDGESILEGDDIAIGYSLGFMYEHDDDTRVGLAFRSEVDHKLQGELDIQGLPGTLQANPALADAKAEAKLTTPAIVALGAYHKISPKWAILGDFAWTGWSTFQDLTVKNQSNGLVRESIDENWNDTFFAALGTEYYHNDKTTFQFGVAFDESPIDAQHRTFRIPDSDRLWVSAGMKYKYSDKATLNVGYSRIFTGEATITEDASAATAGVITGSYDDNSVDILAANISWKF